MKLDKGEGVVIISREDCNALMKSLFSDHKRFCIINEDSTTTDLRQLLKRGEIDEATFQQIRTQAAKPARAHGLPKTIRNSTTSQSSAQSSTQQEQHTTESANFLVDYCIH